MAYYLIQDATLVGIADAIRAKTGGTDAMTLDAMAAAISGISSGGDLPSEIESVTEYIHAEDWITDALGNAKNFAEVYCNYSDTTDRKLYVCYLTENTAAQTYRADYFMLKRYSESNVVNISARDNYSSISTIVGNNRSFYISSGTKIKIIVLNR